MNLDNEVVGCLSPIEGSMITYLSEKCLECIVNIGCYKGRSLDYIYDGLDDYSKKIYCIDIKIRKEMPSWLDRRFIFIQGSSYDPNIYNQIKEPIEFVFIDGDHTFNGCLADLEIYWDKLISGGVMMVHDVYETGGKLMQPEVGKAFIKFCNGHNGEFVQDDWNLSPIHRIDSSALVWKK